MSTETPTEKGNPTIVLLAVAFAIFLTGLVAYLAVPNNTPSPAEEEAAAQAASTPKEGNAYYVWVSRIEVTPTREDGDSWDSDDSGPDLSYDLIWQQNRVHRSTTQDDQLMGNWLGLKVGIENVATLIQSGKMSLQSVVEAASIRYAPDESITVTILDKDVALDDPVATLLLPMKSWKVGLNIWSPSPNHPSAVTGLQYHVVPADLPVVKLIEALGAP